MSHATPANATTRFSNRVEDYVRHRPGYPAAVIETLRAEFGLTAGQLIADVGAGTGVSAELFLDAGHPVIAIEPNDAMRAAAVARLGDRPGFSARAGVAEATTLPDAGVDWIIAAQAFHWFDPERARGEFRRILRPGGRVALLWNNRREDTPFLSDFEQLLRRHATDYQQVKHQAAQSDGRIDRLYGPAPVRRFTFPCEQVFDFEGLLGRLRSSSYVPPADTPAFAPLAHELRTLFDQHQQDGRVRMLYETWLYVGTLGAAG